MKYAILKYRSFISPLSILVSLSLLFFIAQGNNMFVTDFFADQIYELIDSDSPPPAEERSDSGNNLSEEEDHYYSPDFKLLILQSDELTYYYSQSTLSSVLETNVLTPPPERV